MDGFATREGGVLVLIRRSTRSLMIEHYEK